MSGDGGAITGGPVMIPSATFRMSLSHLSHKLRFTGGRSVSGVDNGLPGDKILVSGSVIAEVEAVLTCILSPTFASLVGILTFISATVIVP